MFFAKLIRHTLGKKKKTAMQFSTITYIFGGLFLGQDVGQSRDVSDGSGQVRANVAHNGGQLFQCGSKLHLSQQ